MIVIKREKIYPNDPKVCISYFSKQQFGFLNYANIEHVKVYQSLECAKQDFIKYNLDPKTHKFQVL